MQDLIAIESGKETICYKDTTFIHLKDDEKVDYTWMRDYRTSGLTKYNDNKGIKVHKLGDYRYVEYRNYPNNQCPTISNLITITKGTDCEGLVQGTVRRSTSPYGTISGIKVKSDLKTYAITDQEGNFEFTFLESAPIRKVSIADTNFFFDDDTITYSSTADFMLSTNNPLRTFLLGNIDLEVSLTSGRNRPGFTITYYVTVKNTGTEDLTTNIFLTLDDGLTYIDQESNFAPTVDGQNLSYSSITVASGQQRRFYFYAVLDRTTTLGSTLESEIHIDLVDDNERNNVNYYLAEVTGSYDPNDKFTNYHDPIITNETVGTVGAPPVDPKEPVLGFLNIESKKVSVYRNPSSDKIHINNMIGGERVSIFTTEGNLIHEGTYLLEGFSVSELKTGIYIIRVGNTNIQFMKL